MSFSGGVGARLRLADVPRPGGEDGLDDPGLLFSESNCRYLVEVSEENKDAFLSIFAGLPAASIGQTCEGETLDVVGQDGTEVVLSESLEGLRTSWKEPLIFDAV